MSDDTTHVAYLPHGLADDADYGRRRFTFSTGTLDATVQISALSQIMRSRPQAVGELSQGQPHWIYGLTADGEGVNINLDNVLFISAVPKDTL
jgi:hypothetical protein